MKYPFKFLDSYEKGDNDIFFGRKTEIEDLYKMVLESNVVWLYGPSGTGKTSLIQCGLTSKFRDYEWQDIKILRGNHIVQSLEAALDNALGDEIAINDETDKLFEGSEKNSGVEITRKVSILEKKIQGIYLQHFRPIYLIFDQFEELFILGKKDEYNKFLTALTDLLKTEYPVKIIFVIREDYLGYLYDLEKSMPGLMKKKLRIAPVDLEKTTEILMEIGKPKVSLIELEKTKEKEVIHKIFDKVKEKENSSTIQLPYLQVFLDKLYTTITGDEEKKQTAAIFTLDSLKAIGDIDNVLRDFLEKQVTAIAKDLEKTEPSISSRIIWDVLSPFVSLEKTKKPISIEDLYARLPDLEKPVVDNVVQALRSSSKRIVRYVPKTALYELAHDSLAERIDEKRNPQDTVLLKKSILIASQTKVYQETGNAFSKDELESIEPFLNELLTKKMIDEVGIELINRSREKITERERQEQIDAAKKEAEQKVKEEQDELKRQLKDAEYQKEIERIEFEKRLEKDKFQFLERARKKRLWFLSISFLTILALAVVAFYSQFSRQQAEKQAQKKEFENFYLSIASNLLRANNPSLSYQVLEMGLQKKQSDTLSSQLMEYEEAGYIYLQGIYPSLSDVSSFSLSPNGVLTIEEESVQTTWNTNTRLLTAPPYLSNHAESKTFPTTPIGPVTVTLSPGNDGLILKNAKGIVIQRISNDKLLFSSLENIMLSEHGSLLSIGNDLYTLSPDFKQSVIHRIPTLSSKYKKAYASTALSLLNDTLVAVGYQNGDIVLYSLIGLKGKPKIIRSFKSSDDVFTFSGNEFNENNKILSIATDRQNRYLFAVNAFNAINVWTRNKKDSIQTRILTGHTGEINCIEFSVDSTMMLTGSSDNTAIIWDISGEGMTKKSILKGPNSGSINKAAFLNGDKDIVTVSNDGTISKVYLWKNERPSVLWKKNQIYQFSPFDFDNWGLTVDSSKSILSTIDLYSSTLNYYLNLPETNEFPNDKNYTQIWRRSLGNADKIYTSLKKRPDYSQFINAHANKILNKCRSILLSGVERDIFIASEEMEEWKQFLSDTMHQQFPLSLLTRFNIRFSSYMERISVNEGNGLRLIAYYTDSVLNPLVRQYGNNSTLISLKRNINVAWCKYYLYTRQNDNALRIATELAQIENRVIDYRIYLVSTFLAGSRKADADNLYRSMQPMKSGKKKQTDRRLYNLLNRLIEKNIASDSIKTFIEQHTLDIYERRNVD